MPADPVRAYHDLLAADPALAADSRAALDRGQDVRGLLYDRRPVCNVLRPRFLTHDQYRFLNDRLKVLLPAFRAAHDRALADPAFRRQFRLREWEDDLVAVDPGYPDPNPSSRFDAVFAGGRLLFTGYNTERPIGAGYTDSLTRLFYGIPVFQEFGRRFQAWPLLARGGVLHALTDAFKRWRGNTSEPPRVAILDRRDSPAFAEFVLIYDYFKGMGVEARIVDPQDVEYHDGKLTAGDFPITLAYRRAPTDELFAHGGLDHPVIRAARDRAVCVVNSFRSKLLGKKASVAVLSDERNAGLFTPEQRRAIADHIPWTRVLEERRTTAGGSDVNLVPYVLANKDRLMLRPNDARAAEGVVFGRAVSAGQWDDAVRTALTGAYVVQEQGAVPREPFPLFDGDSLVFRDLCLDTSPFIAFGESMHGCLTRVAAEAPVNVAAGGAIVPTFVVEER